MSDSLQKLQRNASRSRSRSYEKKNNNSTQSNEQSPDRKRYLNSKTEEIQPETNSTSTEIPKKQQLANCIDYLKGICSKQLPCPTGFHPPIQESRILASEFDCKRSSIQTWSPHELDLYNLSLDFSSISDSILPSDQLILIRHSLSEFNFATFRLFNQSGITYTDPLSAVYQLEPAYVDTALHPIGETMCIRNAPFVHPIPFHTVFVSPLRRTLQTTNLLFKEHPDKTKIKFVLLPLCAESLAKVCDISDIQSVKDEFTNPSNPASDIFPASLFESIPDSWQIDELIEDVAIKAKIKSEIEGSDKITIQTALLNEIKDNHYPKSMEAQSHLISRVKRTKELIANYIAEHKIDSTKQKVGLVSHFGFLTHFTNQPNHIPPIPGRYFSNCEAFPFHL